MAFALRKQDGETWEQVAMRLAKAQGLEAEVRKAYNLVYICGYSRSKMTDDEAEGHRWWAALYEWDCIPCEPETT